MKFDIGHTKWPPRARLQRSIFEPNFPPLWHTFRPKRWQFRVGWCLWGRLKWLACWHRPLTWYGPIKFSSWGNLILKACRPRSFRIIRHSVVWAMSHSWERCEIDWFGSFWIDALTAVIISSLRAIRRRFSAPERPIL